MNFAHNYLIYDEFGESQVLCMCCAVTIKSRTEIKGMLGIVREMMKHADYREIPVILSSGNIAFIMVCDNCKFIEIGELQAELITQQVSNAWKMQLEWKGLSPEVIKPILEKLNKPVLRKAETHEVVSAMRT